MSVIKLGGISVIVFAVILFLLSLLIPSHIRVSRAIDIHANRVDTVIADLQTWPEWNTLFNDSVTVRKLSSDSNNIRTLWLSRNNAIRSTFHIERASGVSVVQWYFQFDLKWYPWEKLGSIIFDKQLGPPMEQSLNNLKKRFENAQ